MKKKVLSLISAVIVLLTVFSLAACRDVGQDEPDNTEPNTSKSTTEAPVEIVEIPTEKKDIVEVLNGALDYVELYCYRYTKHTACKVDNVSVGALSSASNAVSAFKSIFGEKDVTLDYDYNTSKDTFAANFPESGYNVNDFLDINAELDGNSIVITAQLPSENNPSENGLLHRLTTEYLNSASVEKALREFNSSATAVSASATDIAVKATVSAKDSSLTRLEISFTERYSLSGVTLVKLEGSSVTASSKTTVTYTAIGV